MPGETMPRSKLDLLFCELSPGGIYGAFSEFYFDYITVYDNCSYSKPNLNYFQEICYFCGISPEESVMVGNDVDEDMCAAKLGFDTFLVTDCLINRRNKSVSRYRRGSFEDFYHWLLENE